MPAAGNAMQLKIALHEIRPPIWRRVLVPNNYTLGVLHEVIQTAMGWYGCHLHAFRKPARGFGAPLAEWGSDPDMQDENTAFLLNVLPREKLTIHYEYDFGDGWLHGVLLEKILPMDPNLRYPVCQGGARSCPPEDCGGIPGYYELLRAKAKPDDPTNRELLEWAGPWEPEDFDEDIVNHRFAAWKK